MFGFHTVDSVVADLKNKVAKLYQLETAHLKEVEQHAAAAAKAEFNKVAASNAAQRARRIGQKIEELIS